MRNAYSAITVPTNTSPGTAVAASNFGSLKAIAYEGGSGDDIEFGISADGGTNYGVPNGFRRVAGSTGDFLISSELWFTNIRATKKAGAGGGTCSIIAPPQAVATPFCALNVRNDTTPGTWGDCRAIGKGRTLVLTGAAGSRFFLEGSDDGSTHPFPIGTWTIASGKTSLVIDMTKLSQQNLANYVRVTRLVGSTDASAAIAGAPVISEGAANLASLAVGDTAADGFLGGLTAAASVDIYSAFAVTQTTANVTITLRNPTDTTAGKVVFVANLAASAEAFLMYGTTVRPGYVQAFQWTGAAWQGSGACVLGGNLVAGSMLIGNVGGTLRLTAGGSVFATDDGTTTTIGRGSGDKITTIQGPIAENPVGVTDGAGTIGTAANTVDIAATIEIAQTTPVTLYANMRTIPPPTTAAQRGRRLRIVNTGTAAFTIGDATLKQGVYLLPGNVPGATTATTNKGQGCEFEWNGAAWVVVSEPSPATPVPGGLINATGNIPRLGRFTQYKVTLLGGAIVLTAPLTGALIGDVILVTRTDANAHTATINNNAAAAQFVMPASKVNFAMIQFNGTDWEYMSGGTQ